MNVAIPMPLSSCDQRFSGLILSNRTRDGAFDRAPISGFGFGEALRADQKFKLVDTRC
jgi:hypothetical protein